MEEFFNNVTLHGRSTVVEIFNVIFQIVPEDPEKN
jgi:hypothetical protein